MSSRFYVVLVWLGLSIQILSFVLIVVPDNPYGRFPALFIILLLFGGLLAIFGMRMIRIANKPNESKPKTL